MDEAIDSNGTEERSLILIVDDVPQNLQVLGGILKKKDYRIAAATSGIQALQMIEKVLPDLILMDIMMPEMDGFEVCRRLKEMPKVKEIPVIFLTARTETDDIIQGFSVGATDYVTKPFNAAELLARVHTHLELKRSRDSERELIRQLKEALANVKHLSGLLPICANCNKIRDDKGYWQRVEKYIESRSDAQFSHGICPDCLQELYPDMAERIAEKEAKEKK